MGRTKCDQSRATRPSRSQLILVPLIGLVVLLMVSAGPATSSIIVDTHWDRFRIQDVCSNENRNLRLYLDFGDQGWVRGRPAEEVIRATNGGMTSKSVAEPNRHQKQHRRPDGASSSCTLELVTCPSCRFKVVASSINIGNDEKCSSDGRTMKDPKSRIDVIRTEVNEVSANRVDEEVCRCNYLAFSEPQFEADVIRRRLCNGAGHQMNEYTGFTRSVLLHFVFDETSPSKDSFNLTFESERNLDELSGFPIDAKELSAPSHQPAAIIASPYFPTLCSRDLIKQHLIRCDLSDNTRRKSSSVKGGSNEEDLCSIRIVFTDFQIDMMSRMEFYNSAGHLIHMYSGDIFRPPVILAPGPSLLVRFFANGAADALRYRAEVDFVRTTDSVVDGDQDIGVLEPTTECGGSVDTLGGAITMMNMVANDSQLRRYDCVWLIRPSRRYLNAKPFLSFRVSDFSGFISRSELVIREGQTSSHPIVEAMQWKDSTMVGGSLNTEYVVNTTKGFYVSFKGAFGVSSKLLLVYTVFAFESKTSTGFVCKNLKCIPIQLQCDGFDHCGDGSDEPESCTIAWNHETSDRRWYSHTPNYYFPKTDHYPDLRAATIVFLVSSFGLIFLISGIIILLYRMGHWARDNRELQSHLHTISELLDSNHMDEEVIPTDLDPPAYEDPPDYDDVIKVGMDEYFQKQTNERRSQRAKPNNICQQFFNAVAIGSDDEIVPTTIAIVSIDQLPDAITPENDMVPTLDSDLMEIESVVSATVDETDVQMLEGSSSIDGLRPAVSSEGIWSFFDSSPQEGFDKSISDTLAVQEIPERTSVACLLHEMVQPSIESHLIFQEIIA